jgi:TonB-dependent receptor
VHGTGFLAGTHAKSSSVDLAQTAVGVKWNKGDNLFIKSEIVVTDSSRQFENFIQDWWLDGGADVTFETNVNNHANFDVANDKQLDPNNFGPGGMFEPWDDSEGTELAWTFDAEYQLDGEFFRNIQFGLRYADRDAEFIAGDRQSPDPVDAQGAKDYGQQYLALVDLGGATYLDLKGHYAANADFMNEHKAEIRAFYGRGPNKPESDPLRNFNANEKSWSIYGQTKYLSELGGFDIDGQVGVRVIETERTMGSFGTVGGVQTEFLETTDTTEILPNLSLNLHFTDEVVLRSSISRTISNPEFGDLNPNLFVFPPAPGTPTGSGSGGNPDLDPVESVSSDLSLEYYPKDGGIAAVSVFYRDIKGYISTFSEFDTIDNVSYNISRPFSSGSGNLEGIELSYSKFFTQLPEPFNGLGIQLNYTYVDGVVSLPDGQGDSFETALAGVSKNNGNAVIMFESGNLFARLAYNYRSDYIEGFSSPGIQAEKTVSVRASGRIDASVGYNITENLTVVLDGSNLNDEKFSNYWGSSARSRDRRDPGRTISLGIAYNF